MTANLLREGDVVFLTGDLAWSKSVNEAILAASDNEAKALEEKAQMDVVANLIVDPYLVEADQINGAVKAAHIRERIRTLGPTVRRDLGKQANGAGGGFTPRAKED
jgi:hypothetical protein